MNAEMDLARQWLAKAENDLLNADNNLKSEIIPYDTVCFHCQQAAEPVEGRGPTKGNDLPVGHVPDTEPGQRDRGLPGVQEATSAAYCHVPEVRAV
jgi:hypothetical protein